MKSYPINRCIGCSADVISSAGYFFDNRCRKWPGIPLMVIQRTISGRAFFTKDQVSHVVGPERAMIFEHGEDSAYGYPPDASAPYKMEFISFMGAGARPSFQYLKKRFGPVLYFPTASNAYEIFEEILTKWTTSGFRDRYEESHLIYQVIMELLREQSSDCLKSDPVLALYELIQNHFSRPLNLKEFAARQNLSREHLSRSFSERYKIGPATLLRNLRLQHAVTLLSSTGLPIADVATRCGFTEPTIFCRVFKRHHLQTPQAYRDSVKEKAGDLPYQSFWTLPPGLCREGGFSPPGLLS